ncbi:MAG: GTP 3',8-cyclase MoaA [Acidimicrobiales bacterium]|nr:GTP 3',8-cyclase MoaA [Actinomycetota bacterium]MDA8183747.1 GTP 3',8-cyclase MoaA [Actinomycetota bacterium]
MNEAEGLVDALGRPLRDLRVSVTDRCNFRCTYCMPREHFGRSHQFLPRAELLSFEEIERLCRVFVGLGVKKIRITGGEPLLRRGLPQLVSMLSPLGVDLALTTNGSLLAALAGPLALAGLRRVTVSLDALDDPTFAAMTDGRTRVEEVLAGIAAAEHAGLAPLKVNAVVRKGVNEHSIVPLVRHFTGSGHAVRFIEYMDVGCSNSWDLRDIVPAREILRTIEEHFPLEPLEPAATGEVARRYRRRDGGGEIGVISSVSSPFCNDCVRARLSSDGKLHTCLFSSSGTDLKTPLRLGSSDAELAGIVASVWAAREDRYSELRSSRSRTNGGPTPSTPVQLARPGQASRKIEMSYIGG